MNTFERIKDMIVDELSCEADAVVLEANLREDLEADSLDAVQLIMAVEDEFRIEIPDEVSTKMETVKDIVDYIEQNA